MAGRFKHEIPASLAEIQNNIGTLGRMPTVGISGGQDINPAISDAKLNKKSGYRFTSKQDHYTKTNYEI